MGLWLAPGETTYELDGTTFRIRIGSGRDALEVYRPMVTALTKARENDDDAATVLAVEDLLRHGVLGWSGDLAPPCPDHVDDILPAGAFDLLPFWAWQDVLNAVTDANGLTRPDQGNSPTP